MKKKQILLMEHIWLFLTGFTFIFFIYASIDKGFSQSYVFLIFSGLSFLMYLWRKSLRKKEDKNSENNGQ